jgi:hypothetical protein
MSLVMATSEVVLALGAEGGGVTIYRTPLDSGGWEFHAEEGERFQSLQDTLRSIMMPNDSWVFLSPISIYPDYRDGVMRLVKKIVTRLSDERFENWKTHYRRRWQQKCRQEQTDQAKLNLSDEDLQIFDAETVEAHKRWAEAQTKRAAKAKAKKASEGDLFGKPKK